MKKLLFLLALLPAIAEAQIYFGAGVGYGVTEDYRPKSVRQPHLTEDQSTTSPTANVFMGYRMGIFSAEGGVVTLPRMRGTSSTDNYWAYKGAPVGSYPKTINLQQTIQGESFYGRLNIHSPIILGARPYAFLGVAYTLTRNREWGVYDGTDPVDYRATYKTIRPIFGAGVEFGGRTFGRVEFLRINKASDEFHVRRRDIKSVQASIGFRW